MDKFVIKGGRKLEGSVRVSGAKNVALKALLAACLTSDEVVIHNVPLISDFFTMIDIIKELGGQVSLDGHTVRVRAKEFVEHEISLDVGARIRTSSMFIAPLLLRVGEAVVPNPGGCRLGARPIDRIIDGISKMGAKVIYNSKDGYFHAKADSLEGTDYTFEKNTHTGTETLILAAVLAKGTTVLENCAEEPEIDELIELLNKMGAKVKRTKPRRIEIVGVEKLHGAEYSIRPDRNEVVTFAIAAIVTGGDVFIEGAEKEILKAFLYKLKKAGGGFEEKKGGIRFYYKGQLKATDITTAPYPGFMTDWQAPWGVLMTQAEGVSIIHETVFENKLGYIEELKKMGADAELFNPRVSDFEKTYNFNKEDDNPEYFHAVKIKGPTKLHNAIMEMENIRAGAAVVIAALAASGVSTIFGVDKLDRGYEDFENRLKKLGANIERVRK